MVLRRACRRAIGKAEWLASQQRQLEFWRDQQVFEARRRYLHEYYFAEIQAHLPPLDEESEIIEIGSGPICLSQEIPVGHKTYIDPLLDDYRRRYPGVLPQEGVFLSAAAEDIPLPDHCADLILCLNVLSFTLNPEIVLHEMGRLLKPGGVLLLAVRLSSPLAARLHYFGRRLIPALWRYLRPYRFSRSAMEHSIARHLEILEVVPLVRAGRFRFFADDEVLFVCGACAAGQGVI